MRSNTTPGLDSEVNAAFAQHNRHARERINSWWKAKVFEIPPPKQAQVADGITTRRHRPMDGGQALAKTEDQWYSRAGLKPVSAAQKPRTAPF
ncbi:hypothetical protein S40285_09834 [Stachybotrys chlorohalonatus IBT 40285]|uniref:Uncharacterized protein n=1 Tax=Stachybotrys chlorohalonatus (strain IBT 40285) TaxID=1283841 RepID=A0A084QU80_STAC4|nr:hypothetical protein S40285_09834 [Stachybotrys chlorohalonata IBT 40285]